jgi:hypothetical protein
MQPTAFSLLIEKILCGKVKHPSEHQTRPLLATSLLHLPKMIKPHEASGSAFGFQALIA